ncbi:hypothetical protein Cabys_2720 [Caldithrix abyssi DSM 13497]|uniref:Uncharacterized protein n=1 Tax=Caldithrix abyssi DSM 13497 TaxID=880073 RepID=A0A1J1CAP5_CALAY|nr:hypothetical protein Cabys_2720 [Caldithrix abyssi DSM 13497]
MFPIFFKKDSKSMSQVMNGDLKKLWWEELKYDKNVRNI